MKIIGGLARAGVGLFLFLLLPAGVIWAAASGQAGQDHPETFSKPGPQPPPQLAPNTGTGTSFSEKSASALSGVSRQGVAPAERAAPDQAAAYYHFVLARRYQELAAIGNNSSYLERAISEYKAAMAADPGSLFLRTQLAELYYVAARVGDAIREAEAVLQVNPDEVDAHRLLASIYLHSLGESEAAASSEATLRKAIAEFEAVTRLDPKDTDSFIALGRLYRSTNQGVKAEETFKKAIGADPGSKPALTYLAQLYLDQGDDSDAIAALEKIAPGEMDPPAFVMLGQAYMQARDFDKAAAVYTRALGGDPDNEQLRQYHAEALMAAGKTSEARAELQKILRADPNDGAGWLRLGHLDRIEGKFDEAREELTKAASLLPDRAEVTYEQVVLEETTGHDDKAIAMIESLLKESEKPGGHYSLGEAGNRAAFLERLGQIYRSREKYDEALGVFRQVINLGPSQAPRGEALVIDTLRASRQPAKAMAEADAAAAKYPKDRPLAFLRATLLGEQGKPDEALASLQGLLGGGGSSDAEVVLTMAQIDSQAKRYAQAQAAAEKGLGLSVKPDDRENAYFILGSIYEREKRYDLAEAEFKKVLSADPQNGPAANYLGYMLADRGVRLEESIQYIQRALKDDPNNGAYLDSLGWTYLKMHRPDLAEAPLEKASRLITGDPTILEHLGSLHLALGKPQAAEQEWERALKEWPAAVGSDFDADEAASLQKKLDELRLQLARGKTSSAGAKPEPE